MNSIKVLFVLFVCISISSSAITSKRYTLPDANYAKLWDGLGRDDFGNIYAGIGWHVWQYDDPGKDCKVYRYNFSTDRFDDLGTVKSASQKMNNWVSHSAANYPANPFDAAGKIHTSFHPYKGKVFFATHASCDMPTFAEDMETYPKFFRGGHLYSINAGTKAMMDHNGFRKDVFAPGNGIMDVGIDYHHNGVYGVGYPTGKLYYHDLNTGTSVETWQTPQGIPNQNAGFITRNMIVDNEGRAWFYGGFGLLGYSHHTKDTAIVLIPPGHTNWNGHFRAVAHSVTRDTIFVLDIGAGEIFRLRVKARRLDYITESDGRLLAIRWDQNNLYYVHGGRLRSYHMLTGAKQAYTVGGSGMSNAKYGSGNPIDKNGDIWMTRGGGTDRDLLKISMGSPCAICATKVWDYGEPPVAAKKGADMKKESGLTASPNPFKANTTISFPNINRNADIAIYDINGREVFKKTGITGKRMQLKASRYSNGIYMLNVKTGNQIYRRKLTIIK
jgi:hypothetical protein